MGQKIDLTGKKFGKLLVIEYVGDSKWKCRCECGETREVGSQALRSNLVVSCGCGKRKDLVGQKFGRLFVLKRVGFYNKRTYYKCQCDCGNITNVIGSNLTRGISTSCGCYNKEVNSKRSKTHGMTKSRLYGIWEGMKQRCYNKNVAAYKYYGAKGIKVCDEWNNFEPFMNWSVSNGYQDNLTIDRKDNDKDYCPENCRWSTISEQHNNMSTNTFLTVNDETHTLAEWSKKTGIKSATISWRYRRGWNPEDCITLKPSASKKEFKSKLNNNNNNA